MIEVRQLAKDYPVATGLRSMFSTARATIARAVDDVSFTIEPGGVLGLVGESGCGKSTTGRLLVGLEAPTKGDIRFNGVDAAKLRAADRKAFHRRVQMIFQDPYGSLNPQHEIGEIVARPLIYQGERGRTAIERKVRAALAEVGLDPPDAYLGKHPPHLSGGQRQRVCIARAIILEPDFVVADEPVSMLDVSIKWGVIRLLKRLTRERGISMLYITHDLATVGAICDRLAIMYLGRIVESGPVDEVIARPRHPYTQALVASIPSSDPDVARAPPAIRGGLPNASTRIGGCNFRPRCPIAIGICAATPPPLTCDGARSVACFRAESSARQPTVA
ncbi:MAG: oligopeptide/dipeptide ABC transporter ATP-binding protein [Beijerinckiaceae bacterium]